MQLNLLDYKPAQYARDAALSQVADNSGEWFDFAKRVIENLSTNTDWANLDTFTGENLRHIVTQRIGKPHHHNAFGALINWAVKSRIITKTGRWLQATDKQSHARMIPEYTLVVK